MYSQSREDDKRWVIPSLDARVPQPAYVVNRETVRYWMVELTLTSGDVQMFYVKAKEQKDALKIAEGYQYLGNTPKLRRDDLVLRVSTEQIYDD